jgi:hypothetical protein
MLDIALQQIEHRARKIGLSTALTARLGGISATSLQNALNEVGKIHPEKLSNLGTKLFRWKALPYHRGE